MSKQLPDSKILPNISEFKISIDAGSKEVYEVVRRPGKFDKLIENLDWMHENKPEGANIHFRFVCQKANALENHRFLTKIKGTGNNTTNEINIGGVSDNAISTAKLQDDSVTNAKAAFTYSSSYFTGDGSTTAFTITTGHTVNSVIVTENGIVQKPTTDYGVSGTTLTFTTAPANTVQIGVRYLVV